MERENGDMRIGFVGVGVMGHGMAGCLLEAGFDLSVIAHRNREPVEDLVGRGAVEVSSLADLSERSDVIILCVTNSKIVDAVVAELKPALRRGQILIDASTNEPESSRRLASELSEQGVGFAEAPLTGGVKEAAAGKLGALVGADAGVFEQIKPVLNSFCKSIQYFGPVGTGQTAKLINNYMVFGIAAVVLEAFDKADQAGVDWAKLFDVATLGSGNSGVLHRFFPAAIEGDFKGYVFNIAGAHKDLRYYNRLAEQLGGVSPLTQSVTDVFRRAEETGHGDLMVSELLRPDIRQSQKK
jgi:3-hydroxyisobutyrate dehydrogenase-like beta-hydroxyacid dehydrogenase